jgi:hypothetical protein
MDLVLTFADVSDVIGDLHPHQCVHFGADGLLDPKRHIAGQVGLAIKEAGQGGSGHPRNTAASVTEGRAVR